ncbi:MAG TPA: hypothetical protein VHC21_02090 [Candidatus Saccharimonadales bacterium]|nr:hypothetical protein [Candidatus Saccharimonadales bacterium]
MSNLLLLILAGLCLAVPLVVFLGLLAASEGYELYSSSREHTILVTFLLACWIICSGGCVWLGILGGERFSEFEPLYLGIGGAYIVVAGLGVMALMSEAHYEYTKNTRAGLQRRGSLSDWPED